MPLARSVVTSLRQTCLELRPPLLDELGLAEAFQWLVRQAEERGGSHLTGQVICRGSWSKRPPADVELAFYRVGQEALSNILKYAGASRVVLRLYRRSAGPLSLLVVDNGRGLLPRPRRRAENLGLIGMHERMVAIGGQLQIRTTPGRGVIIRATFCPICAEPERLAYAMTGPVTDQEVHE
jgi:signal transduction histidine kinase